MRDKIRLFLTGFGMGASDIVPGVSGGTIAFIFGIYEELVESIKKLSGETLRLVLRGKIKEAIKSVPLKFLVPLGLGLGTALITLASLIEYLLAESPVFVWSFFFGLVLASIWIVRKRVVTWDLKDYAGLLAAAVVAYWISGAVPSSTSTSLPMFFVAGFVAIIAMILPGISGSYLLVLMGKYEQVLGAVTDRNLPPLIMVAIGCVVGISLFSRILSWAFERHHDIIIATLTGFMIGSLRKIWPWKETVSTYVDSHGVEQPLVQHNIIPESLDSGVLFAILLAVVAAFIMMKLDALQATKEQVKDIEDKEFEREHKHAVSSQKHK